MEKEERIVVVLLCMAVLSLTIAYATFFSGDGDGSVGSFSSSSLPGEDVRFEGDVLSKRFTYSGGHLLMDVDYGSGVVKVFVPSANGANDVDSQIGENEYVVIVGIVGEYEGELEVVVQNSEDIILLK
ncbi:OB-fold nucleic acid binding domain-containing protein [Methanolobus sp. ZRKC5]|uniref:OB-fold nucleic acid binding domain-containing protein n=1 Tax=unclassified Methanolobus TaxID=2629569 RepID=UPI00313D1F8C